MPYGNPNIINIAAFGIPLADVSPSSPSQRFISEDGVINARARVLGGGSCLNAGFYTRAAPEYVSVVGWDAVREGLLEVGVLPYNGFTYDHFNGSKIGGTIFDQDGKRHTAADLLEYANPSLLTVLLHATVQNILFSTNGTSRPMAQGVVFKDANGTEHRAYLISGSKNEIIISAGALGSPQLLMLSGIGPADHLKSHNISVILDQPSVGQSMKDNPMNAIFVPSPLPVEVSLIQVVGITKFGSYIEAACGAQFAATPSSRDYGILSPRIGQLSTVPPKQRTPEAIAKAIERMSKLEESAFRGGVIIEKIMGPISSGHLELVDTNINNNPSVTFNYFQDPLDLQRCVDGIRLIGDVIESRSFSKFRTSDITFQRLLNGTETAPVNLLPKHTNGRISLEQFCKDTVTTIWHFHGGCLVGSVVDHDYKVIGIDALRVIDGSTFDYSPGTNRQVTVMMLGRYMGLKIHRERSDNSTA
ncbi:hypothetical protein LIER_25017 [Lithospermum erythrorhizon]|uniref:Glucose-methanol-choline oxidoreductase N-terminal domain-containing protein n=1 Tax=Lithospermum erythrorhizon TaxID=34254 RepID=A0AAV3R6X3_LITER